MKEGSIRSILRSPFVVVPVFGLLGGLLARDLVFGLTRGITHVPVMGDLVERAASPGRFAFAMALGATLFVICVATMWRNLQLWRRDREAP